MFSTRHPPTQQPTSSNAAVQHNQSNFDNNYPQFGKCLRKWLKAVTKGGVGKIKKEFKELEAAREEEIKQLEKKHKMKHTHVDFPNPDALVFENVLLALEMLNF